MDRYNIETINDIMGIPEKDIDEFLSDLKTNYILWHKNKLSPKNKCIMQFRPDGKNINIIEDEKTGQIFI